MGWVFRRCADEGVQNGREMLHSLQNPSLGERYRDVKQKLMQGLSWTKQRFVGAWSRIKRVPWREKRGAVPIVATVVGILVLINLVLAWFWSREPNAFDIMQRSRDRANRLNLSIVTGFLTTNTLIETTQTLLEKPGGYLSNDIAPPSVFLDNIPNWEFGVIVQTRDLVHCLRNDISRSRSQSAENPDLARAEPLFNFDHDSWMLPDSQDQYRKGMRALEQYLSGLSLQNNANTQFFARADNLAEWLSTVSKRLGGLSQQLTASVGQARLNTDLAGDSAARQSTSGPDVVAVKTPWTQIDDVFFETRGATWALIHYLRAVEIDFEPVLKKKNAQVLLRQVIRELENTQKRLWTPVILNGSGFGLFANHSLVMASYISRANASIIDLCTLLSEG